VSSAGAVEVQENHVDFDEEEIMEVNSPN